MRDSLLKVVWFALFLTAFYAALTGLHLVWQAVQGEALNLWSEDTFSFAFLPSLIGALLLTLNTLWYHPGHPTLSLALTGLSFWAALVLAYPAAVPPPPPAAPPPQAQQFLAGEGGTWLWFERQEGQTLHILAEHSRQGWSLEAYGAFDPLHRRILSPRASRQLARASQERGAFRAPETLSPLLSDAAYLHDQFRQAQAWSWNHLAWLAFTVTAACLGLGFLFHFHTFPLVKWMLILAAVRAWLWLFRFATYEAQYILSGLLKDFPELWGASTLLILLLGAFTLGLTGWLQPWNRSAR